jgi:hypothetical protein
MIRFSAFHKFSFVCARWARCWQTVFQGRLRAAWRLQAARPLRCPFLACGAVFRKAGGFSDSHPDKRELRAATIIGWRNFSAAAEQATGKLPVL